MCILLVGERVLLTGMLAEVNLSKPDKKLRNSVIMNNNTEIESGHCARLDVNDCTAGYHNHNIQCHK